MKTYIHFILLLAALLIVTCKNDHQMENKVVTRILFLHHSTGKNILRGNVNKVWYKLTKRGDVTKLITKYNAQFHTHYKFQEQNFPEWEPYGWENYPYDYYNIWVKHAGENAYQEEPTLEMLTKSYDVIIWKHCFPASDIKENNGIANIESNERTLENYKLQYDALKKKMHEFPNTKFIVWTPPALLKNGTTEDNAKRANLFSAWIINEWDEDNDNIFIWDFRKLETEGDLYIKQQNANSIIDPHPNKQFSSRVSELFVNRIRDVIENNGKNTLLTGETTSNSIMN